MSKVRDLEADAGPFLDGLKAAMGEAAPIPVPWDSVVDKYRSGAFDLRCMGMACALIGHSGIHGYKVTTIVGMTGDLRDCPALVKMIEDEARSVGSSRIAWIGRRGWLRHFPEYQQSAIGVKEL